MFLNFIKALAVSTSLLLSSLSFAGALEAIVPGEYKLVAGNKNLCGDFKLISEDLEGKHLQISSIHTFRTENKEIKSSGKKCTHLEKSTREDVNATKAVLTKITREVCAGKVVSEARSTLEVTRGEFFMKLVVDNAEPVECRWKKQN